MLRIIYINFIQLSLAVFHKNILLTIFIMTIYLRQVKNQMN